MGYGLQKYSTERMELVYNDSCMCSITLDGDMIVKIASKKKNLELDQVITLCRWSLSIDQGDLFMIGMVNYWSIIMLCTI